MGFSMLWPSPIMGLITPKPSMPNAKFVHLASTDLALGKYRSPGPQGGLVLTTAP